MERDLRTCLGAGPAPPRSADLSSDTFHMGQAQVNSRVTLARTAEEAMRQHGLSADPRFTPCLAQSYKPAFERSLPQGAGLQDFKAETLPVSPLADGLLGNRLSFTVTSTQGRAIYYADIFLMLVGRAEVSVNFVNVGSIFPSDLERSTLEKVASRPRP